LSFLSHFVPLFAHFGSICGVNLCLPRGGLGARWVVWLLYNASGSCNWCLVVCGRCVVDLGLSSVVVCLLVVNWMSVEIAWLAIWFFFFYFCIWILGVHDTAHVAFWGWILTLFVGFRSHFIRSACLTTRSSAGLARFG
jgi:hypothetical protein